MRWITEENYEEVMQTVVEPFLAERRTEGYDERVPGQPVYYEHFTADAPKGVIVISHGFTESVKKFYEGIYYMLQAGYEVFGIDHRGHGRSFRHNQDLLVVHVEHFKDYVLDLKHLVDTVVKPAAQGLPLINFGVQRGDNIFYDLFFFGQANAFREKGGHDVF